MKQKSEMPDGEGKLATEERLVEIETKLAYQEDLLQSLNDIVIDQGKIIEGLQLRLTKMSEHVKNSIPDNEFSDNAEDELPPHY